MDRNVSQDILKINDEIGTKKERYPLSYRPEGVGSGAGLITRSV